MRMSTKQIVKDMQANNARIDFEIKAEREKLRELKNKQTVIEAAIARKERIFAANIVRINFIEDNTDLFK